MVTRTELIEEAGQLISVDRDAVYGCAVATHAMIAQMWSAYLGTTVRASDVAAMMVLLKVARQSRSVHKDNWVDMIGYAALGGEIEHWETD